MESMNVDESSLPAACFTCSWRFPAANLRAILRCSGVLGTWTGRGLAGAASETARVAKSPDLLGRSGEFRAASKASEPAVPNAGFPGPEHFGVTAGDSSARRSSSVSSASLGTSSTSWSHSSSSSDSCARGTRL